MIITDAQKIELFDIFPDKAEKLLNTEDVNDMLEALVIESVARFDENYDPTPESNRIERLMDEIYWRNTHVDNG